MWRQLEGCDGSGEPLRHGPVRSEVVAEIRYFGRYRTGWIRDRGLLSVG